ncbi:MAG TPA: hypothetical protein VF021_03795, partial [Longimicrobiales bacterium]
MNLRVFEDSELRELLAETYASAAREDADMIAAAHALETLRTAVQGPIDPLAACNAIDHEIGRAGTLPLESALVKLRAQFLKHLNEQLAEDFTALFSSDAGKAWTRWADLYALSLGEWRINLCQMLVDLTVSFPAGVIDIALAREWTRLAHDERWTELAPWPLLLAGMDISKAARCRMQILAGKIQLFLFGRPGRAEEHFKNAESLNIKDPDLIGAWGMLWRQRGHTEKAREFYNDQIRLASAYYEGYVNLATLLSETGDRATAERYFRQAIIECPGSPYGYTALIEFLGSPEVFQARREEIDALERKLLTLSPWYPANDLVRHAKMLQNNSLFDEALSTYARALEQEPDCLPTLIAMAGCLKLKADAQRAQASPDEPLDAQVLATYQRAIEIAPKAVDGYLGVVSHYESAGDLAAAVEQCRRALDLDADFEPQVRTRLAELLTALGQLAEAHEQLKLAYALEPHHEHLRNAAFTLGGRLLEEDEDDVAAMELYEMGRDAAVPEVEGRYQNEVGNAHYYYRRYEDAAIHYRLAILAQPRDAVMRSNLALALERLDKEGSRLEVLQEATDALGVAFDLSARPEYADRRKRLMLRLEYIRLYGESALTLTPNTTPLRFDLSRERMRHLLNAAEDALTPEALAETDAMRGRVLERTGVRIPGVTYGWLEDESNVDAWRLTVNGKLQTDGVMAAHTDAPAADVMSTLESAVTAAAADLLTHDYLAELLDACTTPECSQVRNTAA